MNRLIKVSLAASLLAAPVLADEQFGGVGITIYQIPQGVHVVEVIPGTPAAEPRSPPPDSSGLCAHSL